MSDKYELVGSEIYTKGGTLLTPVEIITKLEEAYFWTDVADGLPLSGKLVVLKMNGHVRSSFFRLEGGEDTQLFWQDENSVRWINALDGQEWMCLEKES